MRAVDVRLGQVEFAAVLQVLGDSRQHAVQRPVLDPSLVASMARLVRRVPARKVGPRGARAQDPEHGVEYVALISIRSSALWTGSVSLVLGEERLDGVPLLVGQVHDDRRSNSRAHVDPLPGFRSSLGYLRSTGYEMRSRRSEPARIVGVMVIGRSSRRSIGDLSDSRSATGPTPSRPRRSPSGPFVFLRRDCMYNGLHS